MEDTVDMRRFLNVTIAVLAIGFMSIASRAAVVGQAKPDPKAATVKNPVPVTPQSVTTGKSLFGKYCRFCHGEDGKGDGPQAPEGTHPPNLTDDKWDHGSSDAEIFAVIKDGVGPKYDMKGFNSKLTAQEMWSLVNYIRSIGPKGKSH
jgi:mono/diheme cytochrome c family protein